MALGTISAVGDQSGRGQHSAPVYLDAVSFLGDSSYPAGGTPGIKALLQAQIGAWKTPVAVLTQGLSGDVLYVLDVANDKLIALIAGADATPTTDIGALGTAELLVISV